MKRTLFDFAFQSSKKKKEDDITISASPPPSPHNENCAQRSEDSRDSAERGEEGASQSRPTSLLRISEASSSTCIETESRTQAQPTSADSQSKKKVKAQEQWLKKWSWLKLTSDGGMQCKVCVKHLKKTHIHGRVGVHQFSNVDTRKTH